jgi:hypothetical protein
MATIDVRTTPAAEVIDRIVFSEQGNGSKVLAHRLVQFGGATRYVAIEDGTSQKVLLQSKEHGLNAIKAIEQAIALGWLK